MERHQVLFVLKGDKISQFRWADGELSQITKKGIGHVNYDSSSYWNEWSEDNYFSIDGDDIFDALFLADRPGAFRDLPEWCTSRKHRTTWNIELLEKLASQWEMAFCIFLAGTEYKFGQKYSRLSSSRFYLSSSLGFAIPNLCILPLKDRIMLVSLEGSGRSSVKIDKAIPYQQSHLKDQIRQMMTDLQSDLDVKDDELAFVMIENEDDVLTLKLENALGNTLKKIAPLPPLLDNYATELKKDASKLVDDYGINFDDKSYLLANGGIQKYDFSLLAYTVDCEKFLRHCSAKWLLA